MVLAASEFSRTEIVFTLALMLVLVVLSGAFSGSETALFSLSRIQLEQAAASPHRFRRLAAQLMQRPKRVLTTILVGNTAVNTLLFAVSYVFFAEIGRQVGGWVTPVSALASVLLVVVCGEVTPKVLAVRFAERFAAPAAAFVRIAGSVAGPIGRVIDVMLAEPFTRMLLGRPTPRHGGARGLSAQELKALLEMSRRHGAIDRTEDVFLRKVIDLSGTRVRDVMVPRVEVCAYDINNSAAGLRELMRKTRRKKIPVYDGSIDCIVGLIYAKVLFLNPDRRLREVVQPVRFVPELATCEHLLHHFRQTKSQLAIAVDEYGGMAGLVTLEDVLERIVGDISTPEDEPTEPEILSVSETEYEISGGLDVRYWADTFGLPRLEEGVATVGGLVAARLGRPAQTGDAVRLRNIELTVTRMQRRRVERVRLRLLDSTEEAVKRA